MTAFNNSSIEKYGKMASFIFLSLIIDYLGRPLQLISLNYKTLILRDKHPKPLYHPPTHDHIEELQGNQTDEAPFPTLRHPRPTKTRLLDSIHPIISIIACPSLPHSHINTTTTHSSTTSPLKGPPSYNSLKVACWVPRGHDSADRLERGGRTSRRVS